MYGSQMGVLVEPFQTGMMYAHFWVSFNEMTRIFLSMIEFKMSAAAKILIRCSIDHGRCLEMSSNEATKDLYFFSSTMR